MMLTNKHNVPEPIPTIIRERAHEPKPDRFSVTDLIHPPLQRTLKVKHHAELQSDVKDYLWMLLGTAVDEMLTGAVQKITSGEWTQERYTEGKGFSAPDLKNAIVQRKLEYIIEGKTIVGIPDIIIDDIVDDWKVTSATTLEKPERLKEYEEQLNCYAWLLCKTGYEFPIRYLHNQLYLRDWMVGKTNDPSYPQTQLVTVRQHLWTPEEQDCFILSKLADHLENPMVECTFKERWEKPTYYAVKQKGAAKAERGSAKLESEEAAKRFIAESKKSNLAVECRPGSRVKCENYCQVSSVCPYYQAHLEDEG